MSEPDRRTSWLVVAVSGVLFVTLAWVLIPWDVLPGWDLAPVPPEDIFSAAEIARGETYTQSRRTLAWVALGISLGIAALLGFTRLGASVVRRLPGPWWAQTALATLAVLVIGLLAGLPVAWRSHQLALDNGLSSQDAAGWWRDLAIGLGVNSVVTAIGLLTLVGLARRLPRRWPGAVAGMAGALAFAGSFIYPVVVEPLFNDFSSMPAGALRSEILALAEREDVPVGDVLVADASRRTTTLNAYVSGLGSTRRVVAYDNLVEDLPRSQALVVVAHELAHAKHQDVLVGTALSALGIGVGVGLLGVLLTSRRLLRRAGAAGAGDPAVVPLLLALVAVAGLMASPVQSTLSRAVEARADQTSLRITGETEAFVEMQRQLSLRSLSDPTPPALRQLWFGSHPTVLQRIAMAHAVRAAR